MDDLDLLISNIACHSWSELLRRLSDGTGFVRHNDLHKYSHEHYMACILYLRFSPSISF